MSRAFEKIEIGLTEDGSPFYLRRHHILVAGTTGVGKTELTRKVISELRRQMPDLHVLIFDVKMTGRDWEGYGVDVPIYIEAATESRFLRDLIETQEGRKIDWFFYDLHLASQNAETWEDVLANLQKRYDHYKGRNQFKEEKIGTLIIFMEALIDELGKSETTTEFDLSNPITVVPLNFRDDAFKQLAVHSYLSAMRAHRLRRVLVICDEMSTLAPSKEGTGCRKMIEKYLFKQGRAAEVFGMAIDQEITGISPSVRRQCWNWILGMQTDTPAQKRTVDLIPKSASGKVTVDDIGTLGVGWWYGIIRSPSATTVEKFYLIPEGLSLEEGKQVIEGKMPVEEIMERMEKLRSQDLEDEEMYRQKYQKEKARADELEQKFAQLEHDYMELKMGSEETVNEDMVKAMASQLAKAKEEVQGFKTERESNVAAIIKLERELAEEQEKTKSLSLKEAERCDQLEEAHKELKKYRSAVEGLAEVVSERVPEPSGRKRKLDLEDVELEVHVSKEEPEELKLSNKTVLGKIMYVALKDLNREGFVEKELSDACMERSWNIKHSTLAPSLGNLVKDGLLIKIPSTRPTRYKLPSKLTFEVDE